MHKKYDEIISSLVEVIKAELAKGNPICNPEVDGHGLGAVVDMVKDMEVAKAECYKACYYKLVAEAMKESDEKEDWEDTYEELMGYNSHRNAKGQYSTASGRTKGYTPDFRMDPHGMPDMFDPQFPRHMRERDLMGYNHNSREPERGRAYEEYRNAMRHYTESGNPQDKVMADYWRNQNLNEALMNLREMWNESDPNLRKGMEENLTGLLKEIKEAR